MLIETSKIDHIWAELKGAKYFSSLHIRSGYHHISIHPESRPKTAFICPYGKFQWRRDSYGIAHAPSVFLSAMFKFFFNYLDDFMIFYVDDVIIYSKTEQDHITHLWKIFEKFHYAGLKLKPSKCDFFNLHIDYLGHLIFGAGIYPLKQKVQAILDLAPPSKVSHVRHILGLASYYRKFIPLFNSIVSPITSLTKKNAVFVFGQQLVQAALDTIEHTITNNPVLIYPDPNKQYHLFTDT